MNFLTTRRLLLMLLLTTVFIYSCNNESYTPKPRGYARIEFPEKEYIHYSEACRFEFDIPVYANVTLDDTRTAQSCWLNINLPQFNGRIHLSYHNIKNNAQKLTELTEDCRKLAFKHTQKATAIDEAEIIDKGKKIYGVYYLLDGNVASSLQFYVTDSTNNFVRGALYFRSEPKLDSIQPVLDFVKTDVEQMIKTFQWK